MGASMEALLSSADVIAEFAVSSTSDSVAAAAACMSTQ
jgi:hypothetical protein